MFKLARNSIVAALVVIPIVTACQAQAAPTSAPTAVPLVTSAPTTPPTATSVPSPDATVDASTGSVLPLDDGQVLAAGRYAVGDPFLAPLSIEVPTATQVDALREGNVAFSATSGWLGVFIADAVYPDPCTSTQPVRTATSDALVTALQSMKGFTSSLAIPSEIDGRRTRSFDIANDIDTESAGCAGGPMLPLFRSIGNPDGEATNGGTHQRLWIVDGAPSGNVPSSYEGPVLIVADAWPTDVDLAKLKQIASSIDFE